MTRTVKQVKGEAEGRHVQAVKGALEEAQQKMAEEPGWSSAVAGAAKADVAGRAVRGVALARGRPIAAAVGVVAEV